jgi:hypothetical protein
MPEISGRPHTKKQMGDAGEMLVAAELTLHGVPAFIVPSNWPGFDVVAEPLLGMPLQRVSVKTRTYVRSGNWVGYSNGDDFEWLAIVVLPGEGSAMRRINIVPLAIADKRSYLAAPRNGRGFFVHKLNELPPVQIPIEATTPAGGWGLADYEDNFRLETNPSRGGPLSKHIVNTPANHFSIHP